MGYGASSFIIKWINFLTLALSVFIIGLGIYLATKHGDCEKFLTIPVIVLGAFIFTVSLLGFVGAWKDITFLLWTYLIIMFLLLAALALFTIFAFVITNEGAGHAVSGQGYKEYRLGDYSHWIQKALNNTSNWMHIRSCLVDTQYCAELYLQYTTTQQFLNGNLNSIQSCCCRPPSECGFVMKNASNWDLTNNPQSTNPDCLQYKNTPDVRCFNCTSCKAGVAQYIKKDWRLVAIVNIAVFLSLIVLYTVGCCARRNASRAQYTKV